MTSRYTPQYDSRHYSLVLKSLIPLGLIGGSVAVACGEELEPEMLNPLVVTATGSGMDRFDTSLPMNVLEAKQLEDRVVVSATELFRREPGVDAVTAGPGSVHPVIRGLHGERVLMLVNGMRMAEMRPGGNHVFSLDPAQMERMEVVRGPASVLYGSDAIGGVVNFFTKGADEEIVEESRLSGEADVRAQSNGEGFASSTHIRFGEGRFNGYVGGVYRDTANIENSAGEVQNSFYDGFTMWGGGNYIGEGWKTWFDYSFMQADIGIPSAPAFADDYFKDEKHHRFAWGLEANDLTTEIERFSVDLGWQRHERHRYRRKVAGTPPPVQGDMEVDIIVDIDTFTLKPQMVYVPTDSHRITTGIDMFYEKVSSQRSIRDTASSWVNPNFDGVPVIPDSSRLGAGVFVQDQITLNDRWILTPGVRADWIEARTDGHARHQIQDSMSSNYMAMAGNLGLLFKASDEVNWYANVGRAFRAPTLTELYFYGPHDVSNDIGNPDLDAETSCNFDFGVKTRFGDVQSTLSVFYNKVDDYIVAERQNNGDFEYKNYANVSFYGAEGEMEWEMGGGVTSFASVSLVRGENDDTGTDLPGVPPLKANFGVRYERAFGSGNLFWTELSGRYAASQDRIGPNERPTDSYTVGDIQIGVDLGETWSVSAAIENFTDRLYQDHMSSTWQSFGLNDQSGRNCKLMVKARF